GGASPSARAAAPSALASSPRSSTSADHQAKARIRLDQMRAAIDRAMGDGEKRGPADNHDGVYGVSYAQLRDIEEPAQRPGSAGVDQVLPALSGPPAAPRGTVGRLPAGWGYDQ